MTIVGTRYDAMFERLAARGEGAFIPFAMLGDPDPVRSATLLDALVDGGADALELGVPFSDPIADGPVIQEAALRALASGVRPTDALDLVAPVRERHPDLPIGLLTYAQLVVHDGTTRFYERAADAGVDSVLVADVPSREAGPFVDAARAAGVAPVLIAPPNATPATLDLVARASAGYVYCVARRGVTGAQDEWTPEAIGLFDELAARCAAPGVLGFGISRPRHVRAALDAGAAGAIAGSAVVRRAHEDGVDAARAYVTEMKDATCA